MRDQALTLAIHHPAILVDSLPGQQRFHHSQRYKSRAFAADLRRFGGRPQAARRNHQKAVALKRIKRAEARGGCRLRTRRGGEPLVGETELRHGGAYGGKNRIAVIDEIYAITRTGIRAKTPGPKWTKAHDKAEVGTGRHAIRRACPRSPRPSPSPARLRGRRRPAIPAQRLPRHKSFCRARPASGSREPRGRCRAIRRRPGYRLRVNANLPRHAQAVRDLPDTAHPSRCGNGSALPPERARASVDSPAK